MAAVPTPVSPLFVHLSDIHFDAAGNTTKGPNHLARQNLLDDLRAGRAEIGPPEAVLVTGDIAFSGKEHQYAQARQFLRTVTDRLGIEPERVQTVPGNHDVDRSLVVGGVRASREALRAMAPLEADKALREYLEQDPSDPLFAPVAAYREFAADYGCAVSGRSPYWEVDWQLGARHVLRVRGMTTVMVSDSGDRKANLIVGSDQTSLATEARNDVVMVLGHHPPDWWHDQDDCEGHMRGFASVHLYGHKHRHHLSVQDASVRLVAGAVHPERTSDWEPRYNWLRINLDGEGTPAPVLRVEVWPRVMPPSENVFRSGSEQGGWEPDVRVVPLRRLNRAAVTVVPDPRPGLDPSRPSQHAAAFLATAKRVPMTDESGRLSRLRNAVYRFGELGYATQTGILADLGLIQDDDRDLPVEEQFRAAFARAGSQGMLSQLLRRIEEQVAAAGEGG